MSRNPDVLFARVTKRTPAGCFCPAGASLCTSLLFDPSCHAGRSVLDYLELQLLAFDLGSSVLCADQADSADGFLGVHTDMGGNDDILQGAQRVVLCHGLLLGYIQSGTCDMAYRSCSLTIPPLAVLMM